MNTILAAIDDSTAAAPVLAFADAMASLLAASVDAVHVREGDGHTASAVAEHAGLGLRVVDGDPVIEVVKAAGDPAVTLVVVGTRGQPTGARPAGHVALALLERIDKPVLVVPPDAVLPDPNHPIHRVLFPLEGTPGSSSSVAEMLHRLAAADVELVGVHVFDTTTAPAFWDQPAHAEQSWANEFVTRWCAGSDVDLRLRRGAPPETVVEVAASERVDLIALGWSRHMRPGRAAVVRAALTDSCIPVLLVPARV